jgi:hypothetical protein
LFNASTNESEKKKKFFLEFIEKNEYLQGAPDKSLSGDFGSDKI